MDLNLQASATENRILDPERTFETYKKFKLGKPNQNKKGMKQTVAKKDNKSHHDKGVKLNLNRQEHANSFIQRRDPRLNTQQIAEQNLAQNHQDGNHHYRQTQLAKAEAAKAFDDKDFQE